MKQAGTVLACNALRPLLRFLLTLCLVILTPVLIIAAGPNGNKPAAQSTPLYTTSGTSDEEAGPCTPVSLCTGEAYYDTLQFYVWDRNFTFEILNGPGSFSSEFIGDSIYGYFELHPQTSGDYYTRFALVHWDTLNGVPTCDTLIVRRHLCVTVGGQPVTLPDTCFAGHFCSAPCPRVLPIPCINPGGGQLTFTKLSGPGTIDSHTGKITYTANSSGVYNFVVAVSNGCYADTASICDSITINKAPVVTCPVPQKFTTCRPDTFCTTIDVFDPDLENVTLSIVSGSGWLNGTTLCIPVEGTGVYNVTVAATDSCGAADTCTVTVTVEGNRPPYVTSANDFSMSLCGPEQICVTVNADDQDLDIATIVSNIGTYNNQTHQVCFTADTAGVYTIITTATDSCGAWDSDTTLVTVDVNPPPVVDLGDDFAANFCGVDTVCFPITITDDNIEQVFPSIGNYNAQTGELCVVLEQSGSYPVIVRVVDACGAEAVDTVVITVGSGVPPVVSLGGDFSTSLCGTDSICIPLTITGGTIEQVIPSVGSYNAETGEVCFLPGQVGSYQVVVRVIDQCGGEGVDTVTVNVGAGVPPVISVGNNHDTLLVCTNQTTVCIPVETVPGATVQSNIGSYNVENGTICFEPIESQRTYVFIVSATDSCGRQSSDTSTVYVLFSPLVHENALQVYTQCTPQQICLPIGTDAPFDSAVASIGTFNPETREWCYTPAGTGYYTGTVTLYDSCGAFWVERFSIAVTIGGGAPPVVTNVPDFSMSMCTDVPQCFNIAHVNDADNTLLSITSNYGDLSPGSSENTWKLCFLPDSAGVYEIIVTATDSCGATDSDTTFVTFTPKYYSPVSLGEDFDVSGCGIDTICVNVGLTGDEIGVASNIGTVTYSGIGSLTGKICFVPDTTGVYEVIVTTRNTCGAFAEDTVNVTVTTGNAPVIVGMPDTSLYLCYPTKICLPVSIADADGDIKTITVNRGQYSNGQVCFVPYGAGVYPIIVTVTDSCGSVVKDTSYVTITTDQNVKITWPKDTTVMVCDNNTFCFPVLGIPAGATVTVSGIGASWNAQTQSVCLTSQCAVKTKITVKVSTTCNTFTGVFNVDVKCNDAPLVILPPNYTTGICASSQICVPVGISDADHNIANITVTGGLYDPFSGRICFTADTMGVYRIFASATDSCGKSDMDTLFVTVNNNNPPVITPAVLDTSVALCSLTEQICIPVSGYDGGQAVTITTNLGTYNPANGTVCFTPNQVGTFQLTVIAKDVCGAADTSLITVHVQTITPVDIQCPSGPLAVSPLCAPGQVCVPLVVTGANVTVTPNYGTWANGQLCFNADTSGTYQIRVIASGVCNTDTCVVTVPVTIQPTAVVTCPGDTTVKLCVADTLCFDIAKSASVTSLSISGPGYLNGTQVCVPITQTGFYTIRVIGNGPCGADTCTFSVNATVNKPPVVNAGRDTTITLCALQQICLPISYSDPDNSITQIITTLGQINGNQVCFTPPSFGMYTLIIRATDSCGVFKSDTAMINVVQGSFANITCPQTQFFTICGTDTICVSIPITPANAAVTVSRGTYNAQTGQLCIPVSNTETFSVRVIAQATCDADTCNFTVNVTKAQPPVVTCPGFIDTTLCLVSPDTICVPVTVTGTGVTVSVQPSGYYSGGYVCVPVTTAGSKAFKIIGTNMCGVDTCDLQLNVTADTPPILTVPVSFSIERCADDTEPICIDGIFAHDTRSAATLTKICGPGTLTLTRPDSGKICFVPDGFGTFEFCVSASDGCDTTVNSFSVIVTEKENCDLCVRIWLEAGPCTPVGLTTPVDLMIETNDAIGGFDVLLKFDASVMQFQSVTIQDGAIDGWEYFTYRLNSAACNGPCPAGLIRFIGIADANNGAHHPPASTLEPNGRLARINFLVANDQTLGDQFLPISFVWYDCGDNSFSNLAGTELFIDKRIYGPESALLWDEDDNVHYPESGRPVGLGAPDVCLNDDAKTLPTRCIEFINGGICVIHPDSIDARGDINLNEVPYEIADAVLYSNYFVRGLSVFNINIPGQIAASDVNRDGLTLSVADLVLMIRIITGDAPPSPKLNPVPTPMALNNTFENGEMLVTTNSVDEIGAMRLVYAITDNAVIDIPRLAADAQQMDMLWSVEDNQLRILVSKIGTERISSGERELIAIPVSGDGTLELVSAEIVNYEGQPFTVGKGNAAVPTNFSLSQNYPNPFNPTTTIAFALPNACEWKLKIYTVTGAMVREYSGASQAGEQKVIWDGCSSDGAKSASGVYFYRLEAGSYSASKKMVLIK